MRSLVLGVSELLESIQFVLRQILLDICAGFADYP
jgi:hypothetical protein